MPNAHPRGVGLENSPKATKPNPRVWWCWLQHAWMGNPLGSAYDLADCLPSCQISPLVQSGPRNKICNTRLCNFGLTPPKENLKKSGISPFLIWKTMGVPGCPMHTPDGVCVGKFTKGNQTKPKGVVVLALERLDWQSIG